MLGRRRARNLFSQSLREADGAANALTDIFSNIGGFVGGEPIADDISLLFVKRV
jgi:serine phosphatase RsbU (regulator of sigma subunit)